MEKTTFIRSIKSHKKISPFKRYGIAYEDVYCNVPPAITGFKGVARGGGSWGARDPPFLLF